MKNDTWGLQFRFLSQSGKRFRSLNIINHNFSNLVARDLLKILNQVLGRPFHYYLHVLRFSGGDAFL